MKKGVMKSLSFVIAVLMCVCSMGLMVFAENEVPAGYFELGVDNSSFENNGGADPIPGYMNETSYNSNFISGFDTYQYASVSDAAAHTGSNSLLVYDAEDNGSTRVTTDTIIAAASINYMAEFWASFPEGDYGPANDGLTLNSYTDTSKTYKLQAVLRFYHANGALRTTAPANYVDVVPTAVVGEWAKYTIPATISTSDTKYVKVEFAVPSGSYGKVYIDDVRVFQKGTSTGTAAVTNVYNPISLGNNGFEQATNTEWSYGPETTAAVDLAYFQIRSDKHYSGTKCLQIVDTSAAILNVTSKYYTAAPGDIFKGSFKLYSNSSAGTYTTSDEIVYAKFDFYNAGKTKISTGSTDLYKKAFKNVININISQQRWATFTLDKKVAPANTAFVKISFYTVAATKTNIFIDDINIYSTGVSTVEPPPATYTDMSLLNPGFEDVTNGEIDNWTLFGSNITEAAYYGIEDKTVDANAIVNSGNKSLKIVDGNNTDVVMFTTPMYKAQQGGTYQVSGYIYNVKDPVLLKGSRALIYMYEYDSAGKEIKSSYVGAGSTVDEVFNQWKKYTLTVKLQDQTRYFRIVIGSSIAWNTYTTYMDDFSLRIMDREEYQYIGDVSFTNADNTPLSVFEADKDIKASVYIDNTTGQSLPITLVAAIYSGDGKLQNVAYADNSAALLTSSTVTATIRTPSVITGSYIKIMVWNNGYVSMDPYYLAETTLLSQ